VATAIIEVARIRPLALPNEHGGWGILLEPLLIALLIAPSAAGVCVALAAIGAFFMRHPLRLAVRDHLKSARHARTRTCESLAAAYALIAFTALALAIAISDGALLLPLAAALPLAAVQFAYDVRNRGRELAPELCGAIGAGAGGAACILAGGGSMQIAMLVWLFAAFRSAPAILHVRALLRRRDFSRSIMAHVIVIAAIAVLAAFVRISAPVAAIFVVLLLRSLAGPMRSPVARASRIGVEEVAWGLTTVAAIGIGFRM
jgi:hypothetical protein